MINSILLGILDIILALIAYLLFVGVFIPTAAKNAAYAKLKAKEREELDRKLDLEHYFGAHADDPADMGDKNGVIKTPLDHIVKKGLFRIKKISE